MFDNPLIWIVIIWWLASALFGNKARQKRRALRAQMMGEAPLTETGRSDTDTGVEEQNGTPAILSTPEAGQPFEPGLEITPEMEREPEIPPIFSGLWRRIEAELPEELIGRRKVEPPETVAIKEDRRVAETVPTAERYPGPKVDTGIPSRRKLPTPPKVPAGEKGSAILARNLMAKLSPSQQAMVFHEIVRAPRSLRRGVH